MANENFGFRTCHCLTRHVLWLSWRQSCTADMEIADLFPVCIIIREVGAICAGIIRPQARRAVCGSPSLRPAADVCKGMGGGCGLFQFSSLLFASCFRYGLIASCLRPNGLRPKFASEECVRSLRLKCVRAVGILFYALSRSRGSRRRLRPAGGSIIVRIPVPITYSASGCRHQYQ